MITLADIVSTWLATNMPNNARINVGWHVAAGLRKERYLRLEPNLAAPMGVMYANYRINDDHIFIYNDRLDAADPLFFEKLVDKMEEVITIWKTPSKPAKKGKSSKSWNSWETGSSRMAGPYLEKSDAKRKS